MSAARFTPIWATDENVSAYAQPIEVPGFVLMTAWSRTRSSCSVSTSLTISAELARLIATSLIAAADAAEAAAVAEQVAA